MNMSKRVDVLIVTFNSNRTLPACLSHIKDFIPYNHILVGDGGSTDGTVEVARRMSAQVYDFMGRDNMIGRIRYKLAERAETDWVLYIDSDVYVYPNFWKIVPKYMKTNIGMVMAAQDGPFSILRRYFGWRNKRFGFVTFSNTLVPRKLILECKELLNIHVAEDSIYARFVGAKGYKIARVYEHLSYHDSSLYGINSAFRRWRRDLGQKRRLLNLLAAEAIHLKNIVWFSLEKRATGIEIMGLLRNAWEMYEGFIEGLNCPEYP